MNIKWVIWVKDRTADPPRTPGVTREEDKRLREQGPRRRCIRPVPQVYSFKDDVNILPRGGAKISLFFTLPAVYFTSAAQLMHIFGGERDGLGGLWEEKRKRAIETTDNSVHRVESF